MKAVLEFWQLDLGVFLSIYFPKNLNTLAACTLHNMLIERRKQLYTLQTNISRNENHDQFLDTANNEELQEMQPLSRQVDTAGNRHDSEIREAKNIL